MVLALSSQGRADGPAHRLAGTIDDYTAALDAAGPWEVSGKWSVALKGESGKGDVNLALSMVRADSATRSAHTHHVTLRNGEVTALANGFRVSGPALMSSNGNLAGLSGSTVTVDVTGGDAIPDSNITITYAGAAAGHFGDQPLHGVVTGRW